MAGIAGLILASVSLYGCSKPADRVEITKTAERSPYRGEPKTDATSDERFQLWEKVAPVGPATGSMDEVGAEQMYHWTAPQGWQEQPATQFRTANFLVGPSGEAECYMSVLPGGGGGPFANANRWRGQMELAPYSEGEFADLPRRSVLGEQAAVIDFEGAFKGMGATDAKPGYRLIGLMLEHQGDGVFINLIGPKEIVAAEAKNLDAFAESLHTSEGGHTHTPAAEAQLPEGHPVLDELPAGHPPVETVAAQTQDPGVRRSHDDGTPHVLEVSDTDSAQDLTWKIQENWIRTPERPMRVVTFKAGHERNAECYVSMLGGTGGGLEMNLNRWVGQFGKPALSAAEIDALPKIELMGQQAPMVEVSGTYTGMSGIAEEGQKLLGAAAISDAGSIFVRITGPADVVDLEKERFIAFCASLKQE
ncbi:MAG: hypothetical protein AAB353_03320 [Candidatus Hydrogenedentota bacterium]